MGTNMKATMMQHLHTELDTAWTSWKLWQSICLLFLYLYIVAQFETVTLSNVVMMKEPHSGYDAVRYALNNLIANSSYAVCVSFTGKTSQQKLVDHSQYVQWKHTARVNVQPQVQNVFTGHSNCMHLGMAVSFWLYLSVLASEMVYENIFALTFSLSIREYAQKKVVTVCPEPLMSESELTVYAPNARLAHSRVYKLFCTVKVNNIRGDLTNKAFKSKLLMFSAAEHTKLF